MTPDQTPAPPENSDLQFEKAEFATPQPSSLICRACKKEIQGEYFEVNGKVFCLSCRQSLEKALIGGSKTKRFFLASAAGSGAALLGAGIYYGIEKLTGYEFGLIALVVGYMVGAAVRWGSQRRGGWRYQLLAVFLTYNAIVMTYLPLIIEDIREKDKKESVAPASPAALAAPMTAVPQPATQAAAPVSSTVSPAAPASAAALPVTPNAAVTTAPASGVTAVPGAVTPQKKITFGEALLGIGALFLWLYLIPFLAGVKNILGLVIIAFGLYEAWKINAKPRFVINGPFQAGPPKI